MPKYKSALRTVRAHSPFFQIAQFPYETLLRPKVGNKYAAKKEKYNPPPDQPL